MARYGSVVERWSSSKEDALAVPDEFPTPHVVGRARGSLRFGRLPDRARRQVAVRVVLLALALAAWVGVAALLVAWHGSTGTTATGSGAARTAQTVYEVNPGPVGVILAGTLAALVVASASVAWRVVHRCTRLGVTALAVACVVGLAALAGMLTVGPLLVPLAAVLVVEALPMDRLAPSPPGNGLDPFGTIR